MKVSSREAQGKEDFRFREHRGFLEDDERLDRVAEKLVHPNHGGLANGTASGRTTGFTRVTAYRSDRLAIR
jgi:hypothetical protein